MNYLNQSPDSSLKIDFADSKSFNFQSSSRSTTPIGIRVIETNNTKKRSRESTNSTNSFPRRIGFNSTSDTNPDTKHNSSSSSSDGRSLNFKSNESFSTSIFKRKHLPGSNRSRFQNLNLSPPSFHQHPQSSKPFTDSTEKNFNTFGAQFSHLVSEFGKDLTWFDKPLGKLLDSNIYFPTLEEPINPSNLSSPSSSPTFSQMKFSNPLSLKKKLVSPTSPSFPNFPPSPAVSPASITSNFKNSIKLVDKVWLSEKVDACKGAAGGKRLSPAEQPKLIGSTIDNGRLKFISILGLGAYGVVYLAIDTTTLPTHSSSPPPKYFAVKALSKAGLDSRQRCFQKREIAIHSLLSDHPNILTLHSVIETPSHIFVVLSYIPDGDLFASITESRLYIGKDSLITSVFDQVCSAVEWCHDKGVAHRDLKPENVLVMDGGRKVVLADFGLATCEKDSRDFGCGSTFYMSPECHSPSFLNKSSYSTMKNDIWSLGVILVNLTCGRNPWKQASLSDETFKAYIRNPDFLREILPVSWECNEVLKRIFSLNPSSRPSITEIRQMIKSIKRWTMTKEELRGASWATREAARVAFRVDVEAEIRPEAGYEEEEVIETDATEEEEDDDEERDEWEIMKGEERRVGVTRRDEPEIPRVPTFLYQFDGLNNNYNHRTRHHHHHQPPQPSHQQQQPSIPPRFHLPSQKSVPSTSASTNSSPNSLPSPLIPPYALPTLSPHSPSSTYTLSISSRSPFSEVHTTASTPTTTTSNLLLTGSEGEGDESRSSFGSTIEGSLPNTPVGWTFGGNVQGVIGAGIGGGKGLEILKRRQQQQHQQEGVVERR